MTRRIFIPVDIKDFADVLHRAGHEAFVVGGAVRDSVLGHRVQDWDIATSALPGQVKLLFRTVIPTGIEHGTVTVRWRGHSIETTTFRIDGEYTDGRHPDSVSFSTDLGADLSRRDFTINGMAADPRNGAIIDPENGLADLAAGMVRAIGNPEERFAEDALRTLRAIRFAARFGFRVDPATLAAIPGALTRFGAVSPERIRDEFSKTLVAQGVGQGLSMLLSTGLLASFLPELVACAGVGQGGPHLYDVFSHLVASCQAAPDTVELRLAALLHDIGKPVRRVEKDGVLSFYGHDQESAALAGQALKRLKYPNAVVDRVVHLIRHHMFDYSEAWTDAAVRRFVARVGYDSIVDLARLRLADSSGMGHGAADPRSVMPLIERVERMKKAEQAFTQRDLAIGGNDLAALGWPKGPSMGKALAELLEAVLDDPELNTRERLSDIARRIMPRYGVDAGTGASDTDGN